MSDVDVGAGATASRAEAWAAFIARITAGATHEIRNMLAITKEAAGLIDDLTAAGSPAADKVAWSLDRIRLQVTRGTELTDTLNRVMHGLDRPTQTVALNAATESAALLARRTARKHRCEVEARPGPDTDVSVNALDLYMALVEIAERCAEAAENGSVVVEPDVDRGHPTIRFTVTPGLEGLTDTDRDQIARSADVLGAVAELSTDTVLLRLPPGHAEGPV